MSIKSNERALAPDSLPAIGDGNQPHPSLRDWRSLPPCPYTRDGVHTLRDELPHRGRSTHPQSSQIFFNALEIRHRPSDLDMLRLLHNLGQTTRCDKVADLSALRAACTKKMGVWEHGGESGRA